MKRFIVSAMLGIPILASASAPGCSIHPPKGTADAALPALTKITQSEAQSTALKAVKVSGASVTSGELEAEGGCLIYSFDIKMPGKKSIIEVAVDAGTGKVLSQKHESADAQAAEAAADNAAAMKGH
ncbi:MAG: PepSY domain-containing protein [Pseudomonadota bacterium]